MEKQKRWQLILILVVIFLTIYNILPTTIYYSKPLKAPIDEKQSTQIAQSIVKRVNQLESEAIDWLQSYAKVLKISSYSLSADNENPQWIHMDFENDKDLKIFQKYFSRAGSLIPFIPAQLSLLEGVKNQGSKRITIQRNIPIRFNKENVSEYFSYIEKRDENGNPTSSYRKLVNDRLVQIGLSIGGNSANFEYVDAILHHLDNTRSEEFLLILSQHILNYAKIFGENSDIAKRYYATFTQGNIDNRGEFLNQFIQALDKYRDKIKLERIALQETDAKLKEKGEFLDGEDQQRLEFLQSREDRLISSQAIIKRQFTAFSSGSTPLNYQTLQQKIALSNEQSLLVGNTNPLIKKITIDWNNEKVFFELHSDILSYKKASENDKTKSYIRDGLDQLIYHEIASIGRKSGEKIVPYKNEFQIALNQLPNSKSLLIMDLKNIAEKQASQISNLISMQWNPTHSDLKKESFPIWDYKTYISLPLQDQKLGLVIYNPLESSELPLPGFKPNSIYVIVKGIQDIVQKYNDNPHSPQAKQFLRDFETLRTLLHSNGFAGYSGSTYPLGQSFSKDYIFEAEDFYQILLKATREDFSVYGTRKYAVLEFTDLEQRILTLNRIETAIHEDLLKWRDEYQAAQVNTNLHAKYDVPKPTKSPLWSNLSLSFVKYFRGDERKILHWGLDLSGGKTVQIQLRDSNNRIVTKEEDIKEGINELYTRVNKMGVSEVSIRQEGSNITLDFPSAQGLLASDLIKASAMYFHVVNEKFNSKNKALAPISNQFLQEVWNEAIVTNRKDTESINQIAWKHLYGDALDTEVVQPISEVAKTLYDQGLRLSPPGDTSSTSSFNDSLSKIELLRGDSFSDWDGQTHPLIIVFKNYALEGANLTNVHAAYDPSRGNFLSFDVKSSPTHSERGKNNPRTDLYTWTSAFSQEKIAGTPLANQIQGNKWRMAVILNGSIISAPGIEAPLRDHVSITGSFSQREANKLEADLKAGSLSFSPHILSEKNVSPELGIKDRYMGIIATIVALLLVIALMISYYRFSGVISSIAVLFNLLIMWATLQNIQATMTLAGIAGIILTVGMAVDANVLVFERIREEFSKSGKIGSAIHLGYRRAFSAIVDSNLTTIIAALILLNFDSGPIRGFAITVIIGIVSSMFTALFVTRCYFAHWIKNPKNKILKMTNFIKNTHFDFLKFTKIAFGTTLLLAVVGAFLFVTERNTVFGMDFTGGYSLSFELDPKDSANYRLSVEKALTKAGLSNHSFQVRELTPSNAIKLLLSRNMDEVGHPFYMMPLETARSDLQFSYENNPRITWVVNALKQDGLELSTQSLMKLDGNWTSISGQISHAMRNNAIIGLTLALICILIYISFRFEFKYAVSATIGLAIDIIITLSILLILRLLGVSIQIDLNTIAALMMIVGYSLNDTIIIFDRIREDIQHMRKHSFKDIINHALNITLSRTLMTSGTTFVVVLALVILGGSTIFGLSLVMLIGVVFGTLSSLFIAAPLLLFFHIKEVERKENVAFIEN